MRIPKNRALSLALLLLAVAAAGYQYLTYSGLYRLASELQLRLLGMYLPFLSMLALGVFFIPGALTAPPRDESEDDARFAVEDSFATHEEMMVYKQRRLLKRLRLWIVAALALAAAAGIAALAAPGGRPAPVAVDLATLGAAAPPVGVPIVLRGRPEGAHMAVLSRRGAREYGDEAIVPVTGGAFNGRYRFFAHLGRQEQETRRALADFARTGAMAGTLTENGLGGQMRAAFEQAGLRIAAPHYLLVQDETTPRSRLMALAMLLFGIAVLLGLVALNAWRLHRKYRRLLGE